MDLVTKIQSSQPLPPITSPGKSILSSHSHSSDTSFPIIAIAVLGIFATAFLLLSYYIFVIKCCLNWQRIDLLRRFSLSRRRPEDTLMVYSPATEQRKGLDESVIRKIPIFQFKNEGESCECAVCLNEFNQDEKLRIIPNCSHVFHIDCIDAWLQNNANCPLCRTSICISNDRFQLDPIIALSSTSRDPNPYNETVISGDEDFVVIEITNNNNQTGDGSIPVPVSASPWKIELPKKATRKYRKGSSMGDECIDIRDKDEQFVIQPIRRSISMDSSADRQLYLAVQEAIRLNGGRQVSEVSPIEAGCSSNRVRRSFFSIGHCRRSKSSALLPVYLEP
ncbi:hypothetical protein Gotri_017302 [Gossypium trilobum]|uniref:RING-type E3 ubiquitin transferase n=1 Tax=Gossypium trilobum TaxID=34281 RepID=A0A7J9E652_9ROSI|nr:hypothetical protein [Gossypium trilobum]